MRKKNKGLPALEADASANVKGDQGRKDWFTLSELQFYKLNGGEWAASVLLALMVAGLIAVVGGLTSTTLLIAIADFIMIFGFAALNYGIARSRDYEKAAKRFKTRAVLILIIIHFVIQMATWPV